MPPMGVSPEMGQQPRKKKKRKARVRSFPPEPTLEALPLQSGGISGPIALRDALADEPVGWEPAVHDAPRRSFVSVLRSQFAPEVLRSWEAMLLSQLPWSRP